MSRCWMFYLLYCCCCLPTTSNPNPNPEPSPKSVLKPKHIIRRRFHTCCLLITKIVLAAILLALILWLIIRSPDPTVKLTAFKFYAIVDNTTDPESPMVHYEITLRNPDLYKSLSYDVILLYVYYDGLQFAVDLNKDNKVIIHKPGKTITVANKTSDFSPATYPGWDVETLLGLRQPAEYNYVSVNLFLGVTCKVFNRKTTRQRMREAKVYFNSSGYAFLNHPLGLKFK